MTRRSAKAALLFTALRLASRLPAPATPEGLRRLTPRTKPSVEGVAFRDGVLGGVAVEISEPPGDLARNVLFFHGGAYVAGTAWTSRRVLGSICRESSSRGWSVDYRLAPEHPYPAALDDALAAWEGLLSSGVDPSRAVIGGESAGGGLALCLVLALRERGLPLPAGLLLLWPWTDLTLSGPSITENARKDFLSDGLLDMGRRAYVGELGYDDPRVSPLLADLRALPPALVQVGGHDRVRDDGTRLAERLLDLGTAARLEVYDRMLHGWGQEGDGLREARASNRAAADWLVSLLPPVDA